MKQLLSLLPFVLCLSVFAQTSPDFSAPKPDAAGLRPDISKRINSATLRAAQNRHPVNQHSRALQNIYIDYDAVDEYDALQQNGIYERFIWDLNTRYDRNDTNRFALTWAAVKFDTLVDLSTGEPIAYPRVSADLIIDSVKLYVTHENISGTPDTVKVSVYNYQGSAGLQVNAQHTILNTVLWDTLIITTTSLSPSPTQLTELTVFPDLALNYPNNRFLVGVHFYGDTALNSFTVLAGYKDLCAEACFAATSVHELNSLWRLIAWANGNDLTSVNGIAYDCNQNGTTGEPAECEEFPIQNLAINAFLTMDNNLALVTGNVYHDANVNCISDTNEARLKGYKIQADNSANYTVTNSAGDYKIYFATTGTHTLRVLDNHPYIDPLCPPSGSMTVNIPLMDTTYPGKNFGMEYTMMCPLMEVDIATNGRMRPCRTGIYHISYCNNGTITADDAYVVLQLPPALAGTTSSIPWRTPQTGNTYIFDIGDVTAGDCGQFSVTVDISCTAVMGQTVCAYVHIYPDSACVNSSPSWDGSSVSVEGNCIGNDSVQFVITNTGAAMVDSLLYYLIEDDWMNETGKFKLGAGESLTISLAANGSTFRMETQQSAGHPGASHPTATVELCGTNPGGGMSLGFVVILPQDEEDVFVAATCDEIFTSYDPNDKTGFPAGVGAEKFISANTALEYKIRFQNTGNDTAFKIVIRDTLSEFLDVTTVRSGASSHPYEFALYDANILEWTFDNIMLPDSNIDEPGSHGYVQFRVSQTPNNPDGTEIENFADIYFDFNLPVKTNVEFNTVGDIGKALHTGIRDFSLQHNIAVYPNPFTDFLKVEISGAPQQSEFGIYDLQGKLLRKYAIPASGKLTISGLNLAKGMYFYRVHAREKILGAGKLVR